MLDTPKERISLRYYGPSDLRLEKSSVPKPRSDEVLVKVRAAGICTTDRHIAAHGMWVKKAPLTLGHEACLEVVELGEDSRTDRDFLPIGVGDVVVSETVVGCGRCYYCNRGLQQLCENYEFPGETSEEAPGFFSTFQIAKWRQLHKVVYDLADEQVACIEPAAGCVQGVKLSGIKIGDTVGVIGCGPIGLFLIQLAKAAGAVEVIAVDTLDMKLEVARKLGADVTLNAQEENVEEYVMDHTSNFGIDVALEAVGMTSTIQQAIRIVKKRGTVLVMGIPIEGSNPVDFGGERGIVLQEKVVRGTVGHSFWPDAPADHKLVMKLMNAGKVRIDGVITHRFKLREWQKAFGVPTRESIKILFTDLR